MAKKAKRSVKASKFVSFEALGNREIKVALNSKNRTLAAFIKANIPPAWNMDQFALRVNDRQVEMDYVLNDGDRISAAPNVAGGKKQ
jgi:molybdopterin converting factor small subunit